MMTRQVLIYRKQEDKYETMLICPMMTIG